MHDLHHLREDVEERLQNIAMTESQKSAVRRRILEENRHRSRVRRYTFGTAAVAAVLAIVILASGILPAWNVKKLPVVSDIAISKTDTYHKTNHADMVELLSVLNVQATKTTETGVGENTCFTISGADNPEVLQFLTFSPQVDYTVSQNGSDYTLTPKEPLKAGTLYNVNYGTEAETLKTWAFQTVANMQIVSTTPENQSYASIENGIEIDFSLLLADADTVAKYFQITPAADGSLECHSHTLRFVPKESFSADTLYTVTLAAGLPAASGETLAEDRSFSFRTSDTKNMPEFYLIDEFTESYLPDDPLAVTVYSSLGDDTEFQVRLYDLNSAASYLKIAEEHEQKMVPIIGRSNDVQVDLPDTTPIFDSIQRCYRNEAFPYDNIYNFLLPDSLENGWYLADIVCTDEQYANFRLQKLIQISDLSVYAETRNGDAVVWVNSAKDGKTVADAQVELGGVSGITDKDGICRLQSVKGETVALSIQNGSEQFVDLLPVSEAKETADSYYTFLYTDRSAYLPTDELCFWGRILPKTKTAALPKQLDLYLDNAENSTALMTVTVADDGTFSGKYAFTNLSSCSHLFLLESGDKTIVSNSFCVLDYTKPAYVLNVELNQAYYRAGETVVAHITGSCFDGTPASYLEVNLWHSEDTDGKQEEEGLQLDENGELTFAFVPAVISGSWVPESVYCTVDTSGAEDVWVSATTSADFFRSDCMMTVETLNNFPARFRVSTNFIDFSQYQPNDEGNSSALADVLCGKALSGEYLLEIVRCYYEKVENGSHFDYINNTRVTDYSYEYQEETVYLSSFRTENGAGETKNIDLEDKDGSWYRCNFYLDANGVQLQETVYIGKEFYPYQYPMSRYTLQSENDAQVAVNDTVTYRVLNEKGEEKEGRKLINTWQDTLFSAKVSEKAEYTLTFTEDCLPNLILSGAFFDGRHVYSIPAQFLLYESRERELNITVISEKDSYRPGEQVSASISITDAQGKAVSAPFALGVVDDAAFAVSEQYEDPWYELYSDYFFETSTNYHSYWSHTNPDGSIGEGGGEGGGGNVRDDFKDTAVFLTGKTDANGQAKVSFTLPDNQTSWRLTAVAVADEAGKVYGGKGIAHIQATLPCFLNLVCNDVLLANDDLSISLRTLGAESAPEYTVILSDGSQKSEKKVSGVQNDFTFVNLGAQPVGVYTLTVQVKAGEFSDAIARTVKVVESRQQIPVSETFALSDGISVEALREPVTLTFSDAQDEWILRALSRASVSGTNRLEGAMVNAIQERMNGNPTLSLAGFQQYEGGLCKFLNSTPTAETTALALVADATLVNSESAIQYLYSILYNSESAASEVASAYLGLSAMKEPVLGEVRLLLRSGKLTETDSWKLGVALALLGDFDGANQQYAELSKGDLSGKSDESFENLLYALILTCTTEQDDAEELLERVLNTENAHLSPAFALIAYINRNLTQKTASSGFSYTQNGETKTVTFSENRLFTLTLSKKQLAEYNFKELSGSVRVTASYVSAFQNAPVTDNSNVRITQSVSDDLQVGDTLSYSLDVSLSEQANGSMVSVILPVGMRFVSAEAWNEENHWSFLSEEDGRLLFWIDKEACTDFHIHFLARAALPGTYTAEPAVVLDEDGTICGISDSLRVTIQK